MARPRKKLVVKKKAEPAVARRPSVFEHKWDDEGEEPEDKDEEPAPRRSIPSRESLGGLDDVVVEAEDNWNRVNEWESEFQTLYISDIKFVNGDPENGWQWPEERRRERQLQKRPSLTINKVMPLCSLITNDGRQNKPAISIKPTGAEASYKAAQALESLIRNIEYTSDAQTVYDDAMDSQVEGGIAYWRVTTDWVDEDTFDQELKISPVRNHMGVFYDCDIKQTDGLDAKYCILFDYLPKVEATKQLPKGTNLTGTAFEAGSPPSIWTRDDDVMICEYYRIVETEDQLIYMEDDTGESATFRRSDVPEKWRKEIERVERDGGEVRKRKVKDRQLEWYKIVGGSVVDHKKLPGKYIPVVRLVGRERVIDGKLHRTGHVRPLKDAQRMYNYNSSAEVEFGALQTRTPWVGPETAFEGNESMWNEANIANAAYLTYKDWDAENEREIKAPTRPEAPGSSPVFLQGMEIAAKEMDIASGQSLSQQGHPDNAISGRAIAERQRQGDTATYHFIDHLAISVRTTGKIILNQIPFIYDTERIIQIMGKDQKQTRISINPTAPKAYQEAANDNEDEEEALAILNPKIGKYSVQADIGPAYSTQRQEAWNAFVQIVSANAELINDIGDMMFQAADFPMADEIAERLRRKIKAERPYLFDDDAPGPAAQQAAQQAQLQDAQIKQLTGQVEELVQQLAEYRLKLIGKDQRRDIQAYDAKTKRLGTEAKAEADLKKAGSDTADLEQVIRKTLLQLLGGTDISDEVNQEQATEHGEEKPSPQDNESGDEQPPVPGARKAPDGHWYVEHPHAQGKYARVVTNAAA